MKTGLRKDALRRLDGLRRAPQSVHPHDFAAKAVSPRGGAIVAASALAVAAWQELEHRRVSRADLTAAELTVERLVDIKDDTSGLEAIGTALDAEWGPFALLGFESVRQMAEQAGATIFIVRRLVNGVALPVGAVQTLLTDVHGDAQRLAELHPSFVDLIAKKSWQRSRRKGGDTAVLLQITTFETDARGGGLGSTLRNALLHMLPERVKFALTTTPVDLPAGSRVDLENKETYSPAMRFHARGGARPAAYLPGYKVAPDGEPTKHGSDVVVMRYERDEQGAWPAARPEMRVRRSGPMQRRVALATRRLKRLPGKGKRALTRVRTGKLVSSRGRDLEKLVMRAYAGARRRIHRERPQQEPPVEVNPTSP